MAVTPRTVLSDPINLMVFVLAAIGMAALVALYFDAKTDSSCRYEYTSGAAPMVLDAGPPRSGPPPASPATTRPPVATDGASADDSVCIVGRPADHWSAERWVEHLDCMEASGESFEVLLAETTRAVQAVGPTHTLAVRKADYLAHVGTLDDQIAYLEGALVDLGQVDDGQLVHRLVRALTWRGRRSDFDRISLGEGLSSALLPDSCRALQTKIWVRYVLAERAFGGHAAPAWERVRQSINDYVSRDCQARVHEGRWDVLAEIVGAGVVAEASNGHTGHSTLIGHAVESFEIRNVPALCREAVPAGLSLRQDCQKRVRDELFLSRR